MHCLHYAAKLKQVWVFYYGFFTQMEEKKKMLVLASDYVEKVSSFHVSIICLRNL